jgi:hypothetical protein
VKRLVEDCREVFGLTISAGGIDRALRRLAERARPTYKAIGAQGRAGPVIGSDETGARVAGRNAWHGVFQTPTASYHVIVRRRNADVIAAFLGDTRPLPQQLVLHRQLADLRPQPPQLVVELVGRPTLHRRLPAGQELLTPLRERPGRHPQLAAQRIEILATQHPQDDLRLPPG